MKLISFIGTERGDFSYYMSQILKNKNKTVLILDNSEKGDLYRAVCHNDEAHMQDRICEMENMVYARHVEYNAETFDKFDYVLCYSGNSPIDACIRNSSIIYAMPDYTLEELDKLKNQLGCIDEFDTDKDVFIIMRDMVTDKVTDKAVANYLNTDVGKIAGNIAMEVSDHAKYISFTYNGRQSINGLSADYMSAIIYCVTQITGEDEKNVKKLLKKA